MQIIRVFLSGDSAVDVTYLDVHAMTAEEDDMWRAYKYGGKDGGPLSYRALVTEPQHRQLARWLLRDAGPEVEEDEVVIVEESSSYATHECTYPLHVPPGDVEEVCVIVCD